MIEQRAYEIRTMPRIQTGNGPGILSGVLMPFEERASDRAEAFARGSLSWTADGILLREQHNRQAPICRFVPVDDGKVLRVDIPLPDTQRGRDAAIGVRNGTYRGLSPWNSGQSGKRGRQVCGSFSRRNLWALAWSMIRATRALL